MGMTFDISSGEVLWTDEHERTYDEHAPGYPQEEPALQLVEVTSEKRPEPKWRDYGVILRRLDK